MLVSTVEVEWLKTTSSAYGQSRRSTAVVGSIASQGWWPRQTLPASILASCSEWGSTFRGLVPLMRLWKACLIDGATALSRYSGLRPCVDRSRQAVGPAESRWFS